MAGALLRCGTGRMAPHEVGGCLLSGVRPGAVKAVPAHGLCLTRVYYDDCPDVPPPLRDFRRRQEEDWLRLRGEQGATSRLGDGEEREGDLPL
jgi:tRNA U38,U39,U40 pseudouridine synthase TruA